MKTTFALFVCLLFTLIAFAQPDTLWTKTFDGSSGGGSLDEGKCVQQTSDGGYIITGYTCLYPNYDVYLIKTNASGDSVWTKTFGGSDSDYGYSVQQTLDGGYIIAGETQSYGAGYNDVWVIKTDASGIEQWSQTFGGGRSDCGYSVQQTSDEGFVITGYTTTYGAGSSDVYLIKTDASGVEQWSQTFGGSDSDYGYSVQQILDGGYIITGRTISYGAGSYDVYLIKTDASGTEQWSQTFGGSGSDEAYSVQQTSDGGYIIAGRTSSYGAGGSDVYLIKTDASGNEQWYQTFGGSDSDKGYSFQQTNDGGYIIAGETESYYAAPKNVYLIKSNALGDQQWYRTFGGLDYDRAYSVQQTTDGGYIIAGYTISYGAGGRDVYLIKIDASGNEQWNQTFGGTDQDEGYSVQQTSDGGYIIVGATYSYGAGGYDVYLIKTDASGTEQWSQTFGGSYWDWGVSIQQTSDSGYIIAGATESYSAGSYDVWLIRLGPDSTGVIDLNQTKPFAYSLLPAYPNPFNPDPLRSTHSRRRPNPGL